MKRINVILGVIVGAAMLYDGVAIAEEIPTATNPRNPEWILQTFDDRDSIIKLSPEEEREHTQRITRLYNLAKEEPAPGSIIRESAGAQRSDFVPPSATAGAPPAAFELQHGAALQPSETAAGGSSDERLIEAVEALQMEIRQLRHDMARQNHVSGENGTEPQTSEPNTEGPSTESFPK